MPVLLFFFKNPLGQKIGIILICVILGFVALNWYGNSQYVKGKDIGVKLGAEDTRKAMEATWKVKEAALVAQAGQLAEQAKVLDGKKTELTNMRVNLNNTLAAIQATGQASVEGANAIVNSVPDDGLLDAIRHKSADLGPPKITTIK